MVPEEDVRMKKNRLLSASIIMMLVIGLMIISTTSINIKLIAGENDIPRVFNYIDRL